MPLHIIGLTMFLHITLMALFRRRRRERPLDQMNDEELLMAFNQGHADAFAHIMNRFERPLFYYILRRVQHEETARDVLQDTFMKLTQHAHRYNADSSLSAWLYTIARNRSIDFLRKKRHREVSLDEPLGQSEGFSFHQILRDKGPSALDRVEGAEFARRLDDALKEINPDQRDIFILREVHGLKFIEIAETLEISENTVKSRMRYALEALRKHLADFMPNVQKENVFTSEEESR